MDRIKLRAILDDHSRWLCGEGGKRADLHGADLCEANLCGADLCGANLHGADLCEANLCGADLCGANLCEANLREANLREANLWRANLCGADLRGANLREANLRGANLCRADLRGADLREASSNYYTIGFALACPSDGSFVGWKKVSGHIVKLLIPEDAKRSSATTEKCRASHALVLSIDGADQVTTTNYVTTTYKVGEIVYADAWDEDRWNECSHGIHFFVNREHAEAW